MVCLTGRVRGGRGTHLSAALVNFFLVIQPLREQSSLDSRACFLFTGSPAAITVERDDFYNIHNCLQCNVLAVVGRTCVLQFHSRPQKHLTFKFPQFYHKVSGRVCPRARERISTPALTEQSSREPFRGRLLHSGSRCTAH